MFFKREKNILGYLFSIKNIKSKIQKHYQDYRIFFSNFENFNISGIHDQ